jgi:hypothetical protein
MKSFFEFIVEKNEKTAPKGHLDPRDPKAPPFRSQIQRNLYATGERFKEFGETDVDHAERIRTMPSFEVAAEKERYRDQVAIADRIETPAVAAEYDKLIQAGGGTKATGIPLERSRISGAEGRALRLRKADLATKAAKEK